METNLWKHSTCGLDVNPVNNKYTSMLNDYQQALSSFGVISDGLAFFCSICSKLQEHFHRSDIALLDGLEPTWNSTWKQIESFGQILAKT